MILEGLVTTLDQSGRLNVAPMGPRVAPDGSLNRFTLHPYKTSTTYRNLKATGEGILHVTDDVELLARAAIGSLSQHDVLTRPAKVVQGCILRDACRYSEFQVIELDDSDERTTITVDAVASESLRDFFGLNRAKHAVVEAAILATRTAFLPLEEILIEFRKLAILVEKTGGPAEHAAFNLLQDHVRAASPIGREDFEVP